MKKNPHIELAHKYWKEHLQPGDSAIDATVGNGQDSLFLSQLKLGRLFGYDIQQKAIENTQKLNLHVELFPMCHSDFSAISSEVPIHLVVYNLGYLPGADKSVTTQVKTTIKSVTQALQLIVPRGAVSITAYPGHEEGKKEEIALLQYLKELDSIQYSVCYHQWLGRKDSPTLFWIKKQDVQDKNLYHQNI